MWTLNDYILVSKDTYLRPRVLVLSNLLESSGVIASDLKSQVCGWREDAETVIEDAEALCHLSYVRL